MEKKHFVTMSLQNQWHHRLTRKTPATSPLRLLRALDQRPGSQFRSSIQMESRGWRAHVDRVLTRIAYPTLCHSLQGNLPWLIFIIIFKNSKICWWKAMKIKWGGEMLLSRISLGDGTPSLEEYSDKGSRHCSPCLLGFLFPFFCAPSAQL